MFNYSDAHHFSPQALEHYGANFHFLLSFFETPLFDAGQGGLTPRKLAPISLGTPPNRIEAFKAKNSAHTLLPRSCFRLIDSGRNYSPICMHTKLLMVIDIPSLSLSLSCVCAFTNGIPPQTRVRKLSNCSFFCFEAD